MKRGHVIYTHPDELSKWDRRFIELANSVAGWSKGPRKRIGAAIVRPDRSIASLGYNGPPHRRCRDKPRRRLLWAYLPGLARVCRRSRRNLYRRGRRMSFRNGLEVMEHSVIESLLFWQDPESGNVVASDKAAPLAGGAVVFGPLLPVAPPFFNLLVASPMLYQQLSLQYNGLQSLLDLIDALPQTAELSKLHEMLTQLQNGCLLAQLVAQKGIEEVSKTLDSGSKSS